MTLSGVETPSSDFSRGDNNKAKTYIYKKKMQIGHGDYIYKPRRVYLLIWIS